MIYADARAKEIRIAYCRCHSAPDLCPHMRIAELLSTVQQETWEAAAKIARSGAALARVAGDKQTAMAGNALADIFDQISSGRSPAETLKTARHYPEMPPMLPGETADKYTNRLTGADKTNRRPYDHHRNRQCSIGYHEECTDPAGETCKCPCHSMTPEP